MLHTLTFVSRIIDRFWRPRKQIDWLETDYALHDLERLTDDVNRQRLAVLITERDKLRSRKKRFSHIQAEIEQLKTMQIVREMRT